MSPAVLSRECAVYHVQEGSTSGLDRPLLICDAVKAADVGQSYCAGRRRLYKALAEHEGLQGKASN